jgi:alanine racemase
MARALAQADGFGVACLEEALLLREAEIDHPITLLEGPFSGSELAEAARLGLETVIHHAEQLEMIEAARLERPLGCWLKVDSGMHRLGFDPEEVPAVWRRLSEAPAVRPPIRLMTQLASAQERDSDSVTRQLRCFNAATAGIAAERSIANSAAILAWPEAHAEWVRPGLMLYGVSPFGDRAGGDEGLRPVMSLESRLIAVRGVRAGEGVGYGGSWRCPVEMPVGVVAIGYGDGYPRHAAAGTPILVNGKRASLIGRASMDMLTVDLRADPKAAVGDPVLLWGAGLPVEEVARWASTIPYELLCGVRARARIAEQGAS